MMNHNSNGNICLTTRIPNNDPALFPFQFVYETLPGNLKFPSAHSHFGVYLVTEGHGSVTANEKKLILKPGDLFFILAGTAYTITDISNLKYIYISFVGQNIPQMLAEYGIRDDVERFCGYGELIDQWFTALGLCNDNNLPTLTKGLLYYALALLPASMNSGTPDSIDNDVVSQICSLIDHSYGNSTLSLEYVCHLFNYHPNYISRRFREIMDCSFTDYLTNIRIGHAKELLVNTELPIQTIASGIGYRNALYFSRIFRQKTGMPPTQFRKTGKPGR